MELFLFLLLEYKVILESAPRANWTPKHVKKSRLDILVLITRARCGAKPEYQNIVPQLSLKNNSKKIQIFVRVLWFAYVKVRLDGGFARLCKKLERIFIFYSSHLCFFQFLTVFAHLLQFLFFFSLSVLPSSLCKLKNRIGWIGQRKVKSHRLLIFFNLGYRIIVGYNTLE